MQKPPQSPTGSSADPSPNPSAAERWERVVPLHATAKGTPTALLCYACALSRQPSSQAVCCLSSASESEAHNHSTLSPPPPESTVTLAFLSAPRLHTHLCPPPSRPQARRRLSAWHPVTAFKAHRHP
eukprot:3936732-Rhodomonas_salina.1